MPSHIKGPTTVGQPFGSASVLHFHLGLMDELAMKVNHKINKSLLGTRCINNAFSERQNRAAIPLSLNTHWRAEAHCD